MPIVPDSYNVSPLMEELDAIIEGKSKLDLAEEIWRLRRSAGPSRHMAPNVDGRDFYELCQQYRHAKEIMPHPSLPNVVQAFNNLREYIKTGKLPWPSYEAESCDATPSYEGEKQ